MMTSIPNPTIGTTRISLLSVLSVLIFVLLLVLLTPVSTDAHSENTAWTIASQTNEWSNNRPSLPQYHYPSSVQPRVFPTTATIATKSLVVQLRGGGGGTNRIPPLPSQQQPPRRRQPPPPPTLSVPPDGTVDPTSHVINLIKTIIGAGVLGIPAGMTASFATANGSSSKVILGRSLVLLILIGLLAANGFNNIGQICRCTNSISYAQAWNRTVSETTTILPNIACIMVTFCTLVTYSMVLSDTIPSLLRPILEQAPLELWKGLLPLVTRTNVLLVLTTLVLLPLCLLQSLSALAPFSFVGICGMVYTGLIMTIRYFDRSYSTTGRFLATIETKLYVHTTIHVQLIVFLILF
jgi:Transmembrane amino acid transporter protein